MAFKQLFFGGFIMILLACQSSPEDRSAAFPLEGSAIGGSWKADWITAQDSLPEKNAWIAYRQSFINKNITDSVKLRIAVDSKYWLYLNGELVVFEGGLKRGPTPEDTYYDEVDLTGKLKQGQNTLAILVWYFGKEGMSHKSSGRAALIAELWQGNRLVTQTDTGWKAIPHPAYASESAGPQPNWRLPESNIVFDARKDIPNWELPNFDDTDWPSAKTIGKAGSEPWNNLVKRPIPFWKDYGYRAYENNLSFPFMSTGDTLSCKLPHNAQVTPYLKVRAAPGHRITMLTDHYQGGSAYNMRSEYITGDGEQAYESLGWINGEMMYYVIPKGVEVLDLQFRETGYNTEFLGSFECDDVFYNRLWQKALRTLYVTMRDNYMDCPDRERAQWWGDEVLESGEAFYALDRKSDLLVRKGILELMYWQRADSTIFSPLPTGNWDKELPGQMLASVGYYGFWNYYWHTGDLETLRKIYDPVKNYMGVWKVKSDGTVMLREGGWTWGDWGKNKDVPLLMNTQYYMALKGQQLMAEALGKATEAETLKAKMKTFKVAFNKTFWQHDHYRSRDYKGKTDDRSQGLAVVAGLADPDKFEAIYHTLQTQMHASPYMEKYILEALFQMGYADFALHRMKKRFEKMVEHPEMTTLWEGWGIGAEGFGGGTTNHAWSGGGLTLLSQYVAGIYPTDPGYETFQIRPQLGFLKNVQATVPSIRGKIRVTIQQDDTFRMSITVPQETTATVFIPSKYKKIEQNGRETPATLYGEYFKIEVASGEHVFKAR
ncbi:family 78 glycoside hydrolase catalytic domain [Flavobacteriaceae bacterium TP-CH-4]|uniref:Family 78 glycoside hydrolase catalytic domain n=1 Tax=Pelagihabitans pacificus TaxID=2696054 RepID=A0A967ASE6_9FLAO|nr:alpha-L-rhamnosidase C-terminal domain-containing protein [Pelagihabitans pacificus]NHF58610.1 family 78 glycoside hydrolase catalytic domain [Pelagihabitans pacificus]